MQDPLSQQLTATDGDAYRIAYCESSNSSHDAIELAISADDSQRLACLAADDDLRAVVDTWQDIPEAIRSGIMALVRATN